MKFTKMHGLGNDFIVVFEQHAVPEHVSELAKRLCDRHFGVGADGLVFILPSTDADFKMRIWNADGSEAEQCGNAIRCAAKYVFDRKWIDREEITIETIGAGKQNLLLHTENQKVNTVTVDMGEPVLNSEQVPIRISGETVVNYPLEVDGETFLITAVSMGNPHCVVYVEDAKHFNVETWGPKLEKHPLFPNKTNVEFVTVKSPNYVEMRVWERGAGETLACGSGACAVLVSSVLNQKSARCTTVSLSGGDLEIEWDEMNNHVYMTGRAEEVYEGTVQRENLRG